MSLVILQDIVQRKVRVIWCDEKNFVMCGDKHETSPHSSSSGTPLHLL